jgi:hypothetical protein
LYCLFCDFHQSFFIWPLYCLCCDLYHCPVLFGHCIVCSVIYIIVLFRLSIVLSVLWFISLSRFVWPLYHLFCDLYHCPVLFGHGHCIVCSVIYIIVLFCLAIALSVLWFTSLYCPLSCLAIVSSVLWFISLSRFVWPLYCLFCDLPPFVIFKPFFLSCSLNALKR